MLYEWESKGMYASSNGGYIQIKDLFSTVGINGLNEAAEFLGLTVSNNPTILNSYNLFSELLKNRMLFTLLEIRRNHSCLIVK